jgi:hypothetical protein
MPGSSLWNIAITAAWSMRIIFVTLGDILLINEFIAVLPDWRIR